MKNDTFPKVSIVITSYNRLGDLKETLIRCKDIKYPNLEIIIVDNGSMDGSSEFVNELKSSEYNKIIIKPNKGSAYAHSAGMKASCGKYVITIDDDCFLRPDVVKKTVEIFEYHPNLAGIGYGFLNPNLNFDKELYKKEINLDATKLDLSSCYESMVATSGAAFRKSALKKIDYYDLNWYFITEDVEMVLNLIAHGYNTVQLSELTAYHKSSPINRNFDHILFQGVRGTVMIMFKYYPIYTQMISLFKFLWWCIYRSFINKKFVYIRAYFMSLEKVNYVYSNRKIIKSSIIKSIVKPEKSVLSM